MFVELISGIIAVLLLDHLSFYVSSFPGTSRAPIQETILGTSF